MNSTERLTAYILQIHKNPNQVNKFIHQLISYEQAHVYVHIDKKKYENIKNNIVKSPNVKILEECINCEWGDISQVQATLLLIKEVINSGVQYDFVCLRSGQDLIIQNGFKKFLQENENRIFIKHRKLTSSEKGLVNIKWPKVTRKRYANLHPVRFFRRLLMIFYGMGFNLFPNKRYFPDTYEIYKGSQWFTIPMEVAKYIINFLEDNHWYYEFFENTLVPDESFFHTLIMNSPFKDNVVNDHLYYIKWGETVRERNSPQIIRKEDIPTIESNKLFFARKFDENFDYEAVDYFLKHCKFADQGSAQLLEG